MRDLETVDSFYTRVVGLINQLKSHGEAIEDQKDSLLHFDPKSDGAWISFFKLKKNHNDNFFFINVAISVA